MEKNNEKFCRLPRRLAAILYDSLLLFSLLFVVTTPLLLLTGGEAITSGNALYFGYLLGWSYLYFCWQWVHGGRTLGMRSWKISLINIEGGSVTWKTATVRFLLAMISNSLFGAGLWLVLFNRNGLSLYDRYSGSRLISL